MFNRSRKGPNWITTRRCWKGIETTCDETAAAVVERASDSGKSCQYRVRSQTDEHARFGGVVLEIAAPVVVRRHVGGAMKEAGIGLTLSAVARRGARPDRRVIVGLTRRAYAMVHDTPLIAVNISGHALTPRLTCALAFPIAVPCLRRPPDRRRRRRHYVCGSPPSTMHGGSLRQGREDVVAAIGRAGVEHGAGGDPNGSFPRPGRSRMPPLAVGIEDRRAQRTSR